MHARFAHTWLRPVLSAADSGDVNDVAWIWDDEVTGDAAVQQLRAQLDLAMKFKEDLKLFAAFKQGTEKVRSSTTSRLDKIHAMSDEGVDSWPQLLHFYFYP